MSEKREREIIISSYLPTSQVTPAESREFNKKCTLLGFYDNHDLWHFLSACGMFFAFLVRFIICPCMQVLSIKGYGTMIIPPTVSIGS